MSCAVNLNIFSMKKNFASTPLSHIAFHLLFIIDNIHLKTSNKKEKKAWNWT